MFTSLQIAQRLIPRLSPLFHMYFDLCSATHLSILLLGVALYYAIYARRKSTDNVDSSDPRRSSVEIPSALRSSHWLRIFLTRVQFFYESRRLIFDAYRKVPLLGN